jgi:transcriptional regulator with XRE-family HTH domain
MKKNSCAQNWEALPNPLFQLAPAYPKNGTEVVRRLKQALDLAECLPGSELTQKQFARLLGMPKSTANDWYHSELVPQIRYFLCALERLSESSRITLLREFCRECPRLDHPRLDQGPETIALLKTALTQPTGLTLIRGESDALRTFLITAIGHSAGLLVPGKRVSGVDFHRPDLFVPVNGVLYPGRKCNSTDRAAVALSICQQIEECPAQVLLLNGVWSTLPEAQAQLLQLARHKNVILADDFLSLAFVQQRRRTTNLVNISSG